MRTKLLRSVIDKLEPRTGAYDVYDTQLAGFAVRVRPSGSRTFIVRYRPRGAGRAVNSRTYTVGQHPAMTPEAARDIARDVLGRIADGRDPRPGPDARTTIAKVLDDYHASLDGRASHRIVGSDIRHHLRPALGHLTAAELRQGHVEALSAKLTREGKRRRAGACVAVLRAALRSSGMDASAALAVKAQTWRQRQRAADHEELAAILTACRDALASGDPWPWAVYMILLLILTGARPAEIRTAKRSEVDLLRRLLIRQEHKTARLTGEPRKIELSEAACELIRAMPTIAGNPYLIPGRVGKRPLASHYSAWRTLCERSGVEGLQARDLRRTFASLGLGRGFTLEQLGKALGHSNTATTAGYAWLLPNARRGIVEAIAEEVRALSEPRSNDQEGRADTSGSAQLE